ncbi:glycosyltransferase family 4 protein [Amorphus sp. 3PC139-8]|uniref:glycosyltransferase family 4 protein n=1 Tax=Amorphus sp. 3PC139-8 TaxID=2735676 RepID=UPI00345C7EC7
MQYLPYLRSVGIDVEVTSLFDDAYLTSMYVGNKSLRATFDSYRHRLKALRARPKPDLLWVEYEALPWLPWAIEHALLPADVPIASDYDDAIFHRYDLHRRGLVRRILGQKIDRVMEASAVVIAGNPYLAERARKAGASRIEIVPTVVDLDAYMVKNWSEGPGSGVVGWIGTPETWQAFGEPIYETLRPVLTRTGALFRAVGAASSFNKLDNLEVVPWSEKSEAALIRGMDIGVMPLPDTPWAQGKCGYKLIQYMACGLPVVATPVGVNVEIVDPNVNGYLAGDETDWRHLVEMLLGNPSLRRSLGEAGRQKVAAEYSLQVQTPKLAKLLVDAAGHMTSETVSLSHL